jgi:hypothetical protein
MFTVLALMWAGLRARDLMNRRLTNSKNSSYLPWITNIMMRFLYEAFLEVSICMVITSAAVDFSTFKSGFFWCTSIIGILALICFVAFVASRMWVAGPQVNDSYAGKSLVQSFWGIRQIRTQVTQDIIFRQDGDERLSLDKIKGPVQTPQYENSNEKLKDNDKGIFEPDDVSLYSSGHSNYKSDMKSSEAKHHGLLIPSARISQGKDSVFSS